MNIGNKVLKALQKEITEIEYNRYIKQLVFDENLSKSDHVYYYAQNAIIANFVKTKYAKTIAHLFELQTKTLPSVEISVKKKGVEGIERRKQAPVIDEQKPSTHTLLNASYTFENFVVGSSNQFAYTAAFSVAKKPAEGYNPLFIYGGSGLGKTHLLQAIGNFRQQHGSVVIYATLEQFVNEFTRHIQMQTMDRFKEKYRNCDLLIIDDIQFLTGKTATQEELFHTFNALHEQGNQIILAADKAPKSITGLEDRLKSRFEWGLTADIQPPELETKIAIIKKKCELSRIHLRDEIVGYIATIISNNTREIEGIISKLHAHATLMNQEITLDFTKNVLKDQVKEEAKHITVESIIDLTARELNVKPSEIRSKSRARNIVYARRIAIYLARNLTPNSMPTLAQFFNMKDHTAVSHTMKKIGELMQSDDNFRLKIEELTFKLKG